MSAQQPETTPQSHWFGPFFSDSRDRRVFVRKRWGWGWTFNFGNPATYALLAALLVMPIGVVAAFVR